MAQQPGFDFFGFGDRLGGEGEVREKFWRTAKKVPSAAVARSVAMLCAVETENEFGADTFHCASGPAYVSPKEKNA